MTDKQIQEIQLEVYKNIIFDTLTPAQICALSRDTSLLRAYLKAIDKAIGNALKNALINNVCFNDAVFGTVLHEAESPSYPSPVTNMYTPFTTERMIKP